MDNTISIKSNTYINTGWTYKDLTWVLSLLGTAVGAGVLFLPVTAGAGGFWPLVVITILVTPMIWIAHKGLARFVLSSKNIHSDITDTVVEHFGTTGASLITFAYFFAIYPIVLIYSIGITNTVDSFMVNQLHMTSLPRWLLSGILISSMTATLLFGKDIMLKATSAMVYPLIATLLAISIYLIPNWNSSMINATPDWSSLPIVVWLAIPTVVFSFNYSPIISQLSKEYHKEYKDKAMKKTDMITSGAAILLMITVMFFVFSIILSLSPEQLSIIKKQNISVLSYLANINNVPIISLLIPLIAFTAITSSYFGHFLGAHEGLVGLIKNKTSIPKKRIKKLSLIFIIVSSWIVSIINPGILGMIETMGAPMIAAILFILPVIAMHKVPAMAKYKTSKAKQIFITLCGIAVITSSIYNAL